jgi:two-component system cell cycle response regulator CtrA
MTAPNTPAPLSPTPGRSVLVVDDEPVIRKVAQLALTGAGFAVAEAGDAASALAAVRSAANPFDLVMLDLTLPDGDGAAVIPDIRRLAPTTRVLVVSGLGHTDAADLGADGFLAKPFTKSSLLSAVQQAIATARPTPSPPPDAV